MLLFIHRLSPCNDNKVEDVLQTLQVTARGAQVCFERQSTSCALELNILLSQLNFSWSLQTAGLCHWQDGSNVGLIV